MNIISYLWELVKVNILIYFYTFTNVYDYSYYKCKG